MSEGPPPLAERRERLVALAAAQRRALAADVEPWRRPLSIADRGVSAARFIRNHPAWIVAAAVAPVALRGGGIGTWLRRGFVVFQIVRRLGGRESPVRFGTRSSQS